MHQHYDYQILYTNNVYDKIIIIKQNKPTDPPNKQHIFLYCIDSIQVHRNTDKDYKIHEMCMGRIQVKKGTGEKGTGKKGIGKKGTGKKGTQNGIDR